MKITMIRHGQPLHIDTGDATPADPGLSAVGHDQARRLTQRLKEENFDRIYASPLKRAYETALPLAEARGLAIETRSAIAEFDRGHHEYIPLEQLKVINHERWAKMMRGEFEFAFDFEEFSTGVVACLEEIVAENKGKHVAVVCHGGVINAWAAHVIGFKPKLFFAPDYTSVNRFAASTSGVKSVLNLNESIHLRPGESWF